MNAAVQRFSIVSNEIPSPPYSEGTRAKGFAFDIDVERLYQSKTWLIAPPDMKPWLLRLWVESWRSIPVGTFDDDDELIAARIMMPEALFQAHRKTLMRGWVRHSDGRLYHPVITELVINLVTWRDRERDRKREYREKMSRVTDAGQVGQDAGKVGQDNTTSSSSSTSSKREAIASLSPDASASADAKGTKCPHQDIIALYHERLTTLPRMVASRWAGSQAERDLRARWNEDARHRDLEFWVRFFDAVQGNPHWLGSNDRGWRADLRWLVKRANFDKVIDRLVNDGARRSA